VPPICPATLVKDEMTGDYLLEATRKLTGLDPDRVRAARERIQGFGIPHLTAELVDKASVDAAVAAVLLVDSLDGLTQRGVERTKLLSKLRNDRDVWPTWAELRAAEQIARNLAEGAEMHLELGRSQGRHPDFHITREGGSVFAEPLPSTESSNVSIEFKALGLSDDEAAFCRRAQPTLEAMKPRAGFVTLHAPLDMQLNGVWMNRERRREGERAAVRLSRGLPPHTQGLSGAVVTAQGAESVYLARLRGRMTEAFAQLPDDHDSWVAFHWSNGAPFDLVGQALNEVARPPNVLGVTLVGSAVAFPHADIHNFVMWGMAGAAGDGDEEDVFYSEIDPEAGEERVALYSAVSEEIGRAVFDRVDRSAGVRASVVRATVLGEARPQDVLMRNGAQRILPYVLLIDPDPVDDIRDSELALTPRE
jgi:hypothetical protein